MLKVWLREPHQSDDEAIKLVVDEEADVSDVLLKAPELLRVQHLKPSEIQAEYKDAVLSNRLVVQSVFEGAREGTFVIRPRPGVVVVVAPNAAAKESPVAAGGRESDRQNVPISGRMKGHPPPSPRRNIFDRSPRVNPEPMKKDHSLSRNHTRPPAVRSVNRAPTPSRGVVGDTVPKIRKNGLTSSQRERNVPSRTVTPRRSLSTCNSDRQSVVRSRHIDPNNTTSRFRQEAEKVRVPSKRNQLNAVCDNFKPQWGKPLCATCNHSKQAHWESQRRELSRIESNNLPEVNTIDNGHEHVHSSDLNETVLNVMEIHNNHNNSDMIISNGETLVEQKD